MKLSLFLLPAAASAFSCGGKLTEDCLGETDIRYDKEASNALIDQAPVYSTVSFKAATAAPRIFTMLRPVCPSRIALLSGFQVLKSSRNTCS
jgi:hypothetical protein